MADGIPLGQIAKHPKFPGVSTFCRWLEEHKDFAANYALAKEIKITRWAAQIPDIVSGRVPDKNGKIDRSLPPPPLGKGMRAHIKLRSRRANGFWLICRRDKATRTHR